MKFYIKQKVFSWRDRFYIYDENETPLYAAKGEIISLGKKLHLYNMQDQEIAYIRQKLMALRYSFFIQCAGQPEAELIKKITFMRPKYIVNGYNWSIEGKIMEHDYQIFDGNGAVVASIHKKWISWGDTYEIEIAKNENTEPVLSIILAVDAILEAERQAATR